MMTLQRASTGLAVLASGLMGIWGVRAWIHDASAPDWVPPALDRVERPRQSADSSTSQLGLALLFGGGASAMTAESTPMPPPEPPIVSTRLLLTGILQDRAASVILEGVPGFDGPQRIALGGQLGLVRVIAIEGTHAVVHLGEHEIRLVLGTPQEAHQ